MKMPPLLMTSCVNVGDVKYTNMRSSDRRLKEVIRSIKEWKFRLPDLSIVLVDGSNFDFSGIFDDDNFEALFYKNDQLLVEQFGKGAGEAQDIMFALNNSRIINQSGYFIKCTGKRWVENIHDFGKKDLRSCFKCKPITNNLGRLLYVNTAFFSSSVEFYKSHFHTLHLNVDDNCGMDLEHAMADVIRQKRIKNYIFAEIPKLSGWDGSGDHKVEIYNDGAKHALRRLKYRVLSWVM